MDGYNKNADGGQYVTYERLRAMGTNGFQEPAIGYQDGKIIGTKRLFTDGKFKTPDGKAKFAATAVAWPGGAGQAGGEGKIPFPDQQRPRRTRYGSRSISISTTILSGTASRSPTSR